MVKTPDSHYANFGVPVDIEIEQEVDAPRAPGVDIELAVPVPTVEPPKVGGKHVVEATPVRIGGPLTIRIESIYPGKSAPGGKVLVTSQVKNGIVYADGPIAMHYLFDELPAYQLASTSSAGAGSDVVFHTEGLVDESLKVTVALRYDLVDKDLIGSWIDAAKSASQIPAFLSPLGAAGVGVVYAAAKGAKLAVKLIDRLVDGHNDWSASEKLTIYVEGRTELAAGYMLFFADADGRSVALKSSSGGLTGFSFFNEKEHYRVDPDTGWLVYAGTNEPVLDVPPYVLLYVSGDSSEGLKKWESTALTADLTARFLDVDGSAQEDVIEALSIYSDVVTMRNILEYRSSIKDKNTDAKEKTNLRAKLKGALKNLQDDDLKELLAEKDGA